MSSPSTRMARPGAVFIAVNVVFLWLTTIIAASALWPIYQSTALIVLIAVALALGSLIAIVGAVFRWLAPIVLGATVVVFFAVGVPLAVPEKAQYVVLPTLDGLLDLAAGVALGWKQILTLTLPVGQYQAVLVPALVLVLLTAVIGGTVALRSRRGELAVLAPIVLFLVATAFGPNYPNRPLDAPILLFVAVLFWLVWFRWYRRRAAIRLLTMAVDDAATGPSSETGVAGVRTIVSAGLIMAVAATAAVGAVTALPPTEGRTVLRTSLERPFDPRDYTSPLSAFRKYLQPSMARTVLLEVSGLPDGSLLRIATLDTYDGVVFSVGSDRVTSESGTFARVPYRFDQSGVAGQTVEFSVIVDGYSGIWVPTVGKLEEISFGGQRPIDLRDSFYYNDTSGTAAVIGGLLAGDEYTLTAVAPRQPSPAELAELDPGPAIVPTARAVPEELTARLEEYVTGIEEPGERLVAMLAGLASDGYISHGISDDEPPSRSGHAADRIAELLTAPRMIGDAEQYAVTAALMAREIGFPARVMLGFAPAEGEVRGDDITAWIEVNTAQYGWVAVDPNPPDRPIPDELPEDTTQVARPQTVVPPPVLESENFDRQQTPDSQQELPPDLDPLVQLILAILRVLAWVLVAVALVLAPFIVIIAAKLRRRRLRRRAPTVLQQITGGWQEFEDAVIDHGLSPASSATRSEVARIAGGVQSQVLAAVADRANFSPDEPHASDAESVWRAVDELQVQLDEGLTRWQRIKAGVSLRSLGGYSVRNLFGGRRNVL